MLKNKELGEHIKKAIYSDGDLQSSGRTHKYEEIQERPLEVKKFTKQNKKGRMLHMKVGTACANYDSK